MAQQTQDQKPQESEPSLPKAPTPAAPVVPTFPGRGGRRVRAMEDLLKFADKLSKPQREASEAWQKKVTGAELKPGDTAVAVFTDTSSRKMHYAAVQVRRIDTPLPSLTKIVGGSPTLDPAQVREQLVRAKAITPEQAEKITALDPKGATGRKAMAFIQSGFTTVATPLTPQSIVKIENPKVIATPEPSPPALDPKVVEARKGTAVSSGTTTTTKSTPLAKEQLDKAMAQGKTVTLVVEAESGYFAVPVKINTVRAFGTSYLIAPGQAPDKTQLEAEAKRLGVEADKIPVVSPNNVMLSRFGPNGAGIRIGTTNYGTAVGVIEPPAKKK